MSDFFTSDAFLLSFLALYDRIILLQGLLGHFPAFMPISYLLHKGIAFSRNSQKGSCYDMPIPYRHIIVSFLTESSL